MNAEIIDEPSYRERAFIFRDRFHAGKLLAEKLRKYADNDNVILFGIPAGGVPVAYSIAKEIGLSMDVIIVRKIQIPWNTEAGFGALAWDGNIVLNKALISQLNLTEEVINESIAKTRKMIQERVRKFRENKPIPDLKKKIVILVDDGSASGFTILAAARSIRKKNPQRIVIAVPTASIGSIKLLQSEVDEIVCLNIRSNLTFAVADAYENWYDLTDEEVVEILKKT